MKFVADINITQTVIRNLKQNGHNVLDVKKQNPTIPDIDLIRLAQKENCIILSHDKDFERLVTLPKYRVGIIVIRLKAQSVEQHWLKLNELLSNNTEDVLSKSLTIVTEESADPNPYN